MVRGKTKGRVLSVEFLRLQTSDPSVADAIASKRPVSLHLVPNRSSNSLASAATAHKAATKQSAHSSSSSSSSQHTPARSFKINKLQAVFSTPKGTNSSDSRRATVATGNGAAQLSPRLIRDDNTEVELPVIEQYPSADNLEETTAHELAVERVEDPDIDYNKIASLVGAEDLRDGAIGVLLPDLSRQSVSLDGDTLTSVSRLPPPPSLSRCSVMISDGHFNSLTSNSNNFNKRSTHFKQGSNGLIPANSSSPSSHPNYHIPGNNRASNMPVQLNADEAAEQARFEAMMEFFSNASEKVRGQATAATLIVSPSSSSSDGLPSIDASELSENQMPSNPPPPTIDLRLEADSFEDLGSPKYNGKDNGALERPPLTIEAPSLVASTYHHQPSFPSRLNPVMRSVPIRLAPKSTNIGAPQPESTLCFKAMANKIGEEVFETGARPLDFVCSPLAIGTYLRKDRVFEACVLPAGPQLVRADLDYERWRMVCNSSTSATSLMLHVLKIPQVACLNYILRICGTSEYLLDNDRPLVEYSRLRLAIRDRKRLELLCEDRAGARISNALVQLDRSILAEPIPSTIVDPYYGLEVENRETADVNHMEGQFRIKVHALEHFQFDVLKEYLDVNDTSFSALKNGFENSGIVSSEMTFSVEFSLVYNNEIVEGSTQKTAAKPSPMWVEQLRFPFEWSQLPRELRVLIRVVFRKSKTSRPFVVGEVCVHLFDVYGILTTGKHAVPILNCKETQRHSFSTTAPVSSVYKSKKSVPYLHYEIFELKSGMLMLHEHAQVKGPGKRFNNAPIQLLIPEKGDEQELARLIRIHPLYKLQDEEKGIVWKYRYYLHFSSQHSLPLIVKCINWMDQKMVEELHRLIAQWEIQDPLLSLELLDAGVTDTVVRTFAVDCLRQFNDEELVTYMLQLVQALVMFEPYEDSALSRFLLERALRNRTQVGNALYWNLRSVEGDSNVQHRIATLMEIYLKNSGEEHSDRLASQSRLLEHFRSLSARASKLDSKAKLALLDAELQPDLFQVGNEEPLASPVTSPATSPRKNNLPMPPQKSQKIETAQQPAAGTQTAARTQKPRTWTLSKPSQALINTKPDPNSTENTSTSAILSTSGAITVEHASGDPNQRGFVSQAFNFLNLPLDPSMCTRRIIKSKCKFMVSSAAPMWIVFDNADPLAAPTPAIFKSGDDLRQDILILQMLKLMDDIWQRDGLELHISAYACVATGKGEGFIEVVQDATTTGKIQKSFGASGALRKTPLANWLQQQHLGEPERHEEAIENFVSSCAAYCIASYVLGLGDRHADNIMVTTMGNLFHIDFAHILGNIMRFGAYKRERAPFVLTPEFVFVMGDTKSPRYARFVDLCLKGYNSLRKHTYLLLRLFKMMLSAGLPQFTDERELAYLYKSLSLGFSEQGAAEKFAKLIDESRKTTTTLVNNFFHNLATGAVGAASSNSSQNSSSPQLRRMASAKSTTALLSGIPLSSHGSPTSPNSNDSRKKVNFVRADK